MEVQAYLPGAVADLVAQSDVTRIASEDISTTFASNSIGKNTQLLYWKASN